MPRPPQTGQTLGEVPGFAPVPRQVGQGCEVGTVSETCAPSTAWSKLSETSVSRSRPRVGGRPPLTPPRPPAPAPPEPAPKRLERMSPTPPNPPPKEPGSNPPPGTLNPKGPEPRSY